MEDTEMFLESCDILMEADLLTHGKIFLSGTDENFRTTVDQAIANIRNEDDRESVLKMIREVKAQVGFQNSLAGGLLTCWIKGQIGGGVGEFVGGKDMRFWGALFANSWKMINAVNGTTRDFIRFLDDVELEVRTMQIENYKNRRY